LYVAVKARTRNCHSRQLSKPVGMPRWLLKMASLLVAVVFLYYSPYHSASHSTFSFGECSKQTDKWVNRPWGADKAQENLMVKGKDIVMVVGTDGGHALNVHGGLIKENREEYATFHGTPAS